MKVRVFFTVCVMATMFIVARGRREKCEYDSGYPACHCTPSYCVKTWKIEHTDETEFCCECNTQCEAANRRHREAQLRNKNAAQRAKIVANNAYNDAKRAQGIASKSDGINTLL